MTLSESVEDAIDYGASGRAALSRPWCLVSVSGDRATIRGSRIEVRRVASSFFDNLLHRHLITRRQHRAAIWAMAKHRAGAFLPRVVAKYGPRLSGDRDQLIDDDDSDPADKWREVAALLPHHQSRVLESVLLGAGLAPDELPLLVEALNTVHEMFL